MDAHDPRSPRTPIRPCDDQPGDVPFAGISPASIEDLPPPAVPPSPSPLAAPLPLAGQAGVEPAPASHGLPPPPRPSMQDMRERFGRLTRDPNFWTLMDELGMEPTDPPPANVQALPLDRVAPAVEGEGRVISGRFRRLR